MADATEQARLAALAEYSADAIVVVDQDGVVRWVSPSTADVLGYPAGALTDSRVRDLLSPEDVGRWDAALDRMRGMPRVATPLRVRLRHGDGSWRWVEGTGRNLLDDPRVGALVLSWRDVTGREAAEAAHRDRDARYRRLFTEAPDVIFETDEEGYLRFVNPAGLRLLGLGPAQVIDRRFTEFVREDYRPAILAHYQRQVARREPSSYIEFPVTAADGHEVWLGQNAWLTLEGGEVRGVQAVARDITDRMRLEAQLFQAQKMEAVGRLAGGIAHDFNNLLAAIRGNAELLLHLTSRDPALETELDEIVNSADRAATLTHQLLAFSRRQLVHTEPIDVNDVVASLEQMMQRLVGASVGLAAHLDTSLPRVMADRVKLEQALVNLVANARDALGEGGRIAVSTTSVAVRSGGIEASDTGLPPGDYVCLDVADNGRGMDEATRVRVFEPFFTTKEPGRGTGLGLATVYGLIRQMAGAITVSSQPGRGTTFRIYLPAVGQTNPGPVEG